FRVRPRDEQPGHASEFDLVKAAKLFPAAIQALDQVRQLSRVRPRSDLGLIQAGEDLAKEPVDPRNGWGEDRLLVLGLERRPLAHPRGQALTDEVQPHVEVGMIVSPTGHPLYRIRSVDAVGEEILQEQELHLRLGRGFLRREVIVAQQQVSMGFSAPLQFGEADGESTEQRDDAHQCAEVDREAPSHRPAGGYPGPLASSPISSAIRSSGAKSSAPAGRKKVAPWCARISRWPTSAWERSRKVWRIWSRKFLSRSFDTAHT